MGLRANGYRDTAGLSRFFGATASNNAYPSAHHAQRARANAQRTLTSGEGIASQFVGVPYGYRHPGAWMLPTKAGALSTRNNVTGAGGVTDADAWSVKLAAAMLTGDGTLSATGGLIVQALAALAGSGGVSAGNLQAFLAAVASLTGSGGVTTGTLTAIGELLADLLGDGTLDDSTLTGLGALLADLTVTGSGLSTANVADAVWSALASANDAPGTMGALLANASSAGDPWATALPGAYAAGTAGHLIGNQAEAAADAVLAADVQGLTVKQSLAAGAGNIEADGATMTVRYADGTVAFTRTITRAQLDAITAITP